MKRKMLDLIHTSPKLILMVAVVILMTVGEGCKSKKNAMDAAAAAEKAKIEQEAALKKQREEEELRKKEAEENARREREAESKKSDPYMKLEKYFSSISSAGSVASANTSIQEALKLFSSADTPVLIVISESGGQKDYDRPTTINNYLNYLKDQKKRADKIGNLQFDNSGKITEVELIKQK